MEEDESPAHWYYLTQSVEDCAARRPLDGGDIEKSARRVRHLIFGTREDAWVASVKQGKEEKMAVLAFRLDCPHQGDLPSSLDRCDCLMDPKRLRKLLIMPDPDRYKGEVDVKTSTTRRCL